MAFISLLLVYLILQKRRHWLDVIQKDQWFHALAALSSRPLIQFSLSVLLPSLLLIFLAGYIYQLNSGLIALLFASIILMYSFGRGEYVCLFAQYQKAWQDNDTQTLHAILQQLDNQCPQCQNLVDLHIKIRQTLIYEGFTRLFTVLIYFALAGPVGAFIYRLLKLSEKDNPISKTLCHIAEWPSARLYIFSAAFLGNFSATIKLCQQALFDTQKSACTLTHEASLYALGQDMRWQTSRFIVENNEDEMRQLAIKETQDIHTLMQRSLIFAVVFIAVINIIF